VAAHQVADFAFDLRPGGPVVSLPRRVLLAVAGGGEQGLVRADGDCAAVPRGGALRGQRAGAARCAEPGCPGVAFVVAGADGRGDAGRARDSRAIEIDDEAVPGEASFHRGRRLAFDAGVDAGALQLFEEVTGAVSGITVDRRLALAPGSGSTRPVRGPARGTVLVTGQQVSEQASGGLGIAAVAGVTAVAVMISASGSIAMWP
jgi:hypothetical protein